MFDMGINEFSRLAHCRTCGAVVWANSMELHAEWHQGQKPAAEVPREPPIPCPCGDC